MTGLDTTVPSAGTAYEFGTTTNGPYNSKIIGPRTDTVVTAAAASGQHINVSAVTTGRATGGNPATETVNYTYTYLGSPVTQQLLSTEFRNSVVPTQPAGLARTHYKYDAANGRLSGVIQEGYTRVNGADVQRFIGTFYLSSSLGRVTEVRGPCIVANASATACATPYAATAFDYFASNAVPANNANRLSAVRRWVTNTGTPLTTSYSNYDALGNAQTVTDENGVATTYVFQDSRPVSVTTDGKQWQYTYDQGKLTKVLRPEGDSDVICYRRAPTLATGCDFNENPSKQPTAIFRYGSGASGGGWYEATLLKYAADGELREEAVYHAGNTTTPFRRTTRERNPLGFTTYEKTGGVPALGDLERTTRQFAADGLVVAQAASYLEAPDFCGTPGAPSELCTRFDYWNTGRLKKTTVTPLPSATDISVCLSYDGHGNVTGVDPSCGAGTGHQYIWDDFGNVISAKLATADQPIRYEYDARGNVTKKVMTVGANTVTLEWDYDLLNRPTQAREGTTVVSAWQYDSDPNQATNLPAGCTGPNTTPRTVGRLVWAKDAVWRTWFSYDAFGRVVREARVNVAGTACSTGTLGLNQVSERTYTNNGNELTVTYPSGRVATYSYDSTKRLSGVSMTTWNGTAWSTPPGTPMVQNAAWFPGGNLKSYELLTRTTLGGAASPVTVSYRYGSSTGSHLPTDPLSTTCPTTEADPNGVGDSSGRLRAVYVTRGATNMMRLFYRWKGEQLAEQSRCYLAATTPMTEKFIDPNDSAFQYDRAGRLGGGNLTTFGSTGGYGFKRAYTYDVRGNQTKVAIYAGAGNDLLYGDSTKPDRLTSIVHTDGVTSNYLLGWARDVNGVVNVPVYSGSNRAYTYDTLGRPTQVTGTNGSTGWTMSLYAPGGTVTGSESVMRYATITDNFGSATFNYYYDTQNRRVRKQYPMGELDEYFWTADKRLLMETAWKTDGSPVRAMDEYVGFAGRPVAMLRSTYVVTGTVWDRIATDWNAGTCTRRDQEIDCKPYGLVSDYLGKPVMTFDSSQRVSGVLEYDAYGVVNRTSHWGELAPAPDTGCAWVMYGMSQGTSPLALDLRTHAPRVDISAPNCIGQYKGSPEVQLDFACGQRWNYWSPWQTMAPGESMHLLYCSNSSATPNPQPKGVSVDGYEYRRYETGAVHYVPPQRFPGQYYDAETDLYENWNRYYDPSSGRYLTSEPLLEKPGFAWGAAQLGRHVPAYSYAFDNPVRNVDKTGLGPNCSRDPRACHRNAEDLHRLRCLCTSIGGTFSLTPDPREAFDIMGGKCNVHTASCGPKPATGFDANRPTDLATWIVYASLACAPTGAPPPQPSPTTGGGPSPNPSPSPTPGPQSTSPNSTPGTPGPSPGPSLLNPPPGREDRYHLIDLSGLMNLDPNLKLLGPP